MWSWLDGNTLYISGASGHGFGIQANWTQKTTTDKSAAISSTYTAPGNAFLQTALGLHTMGVASDLGFVVKTKSQTNGDAFGEVSSLEFTTTLSLSKLITPFGMTSAWGFDLDFLNVDVAMTAHSGIAGIALGEDSSLKKSGVPLNAAVPYLYFSVNVPVVGNAAVVVDPSDRGPVHQLVQGHRIRIARTQRHRLFEARPDPLHPVRTPSQYTGQLPAICCFRVRWTRQRSRGCRRRSKATSRSTSIRTGRASSLAAWRPRRLISPTSSPNGNQRGRRDAGRGDAARARPRRRGGALLRLRGQ